MRIVFFCKTPCLTHHECEICSNSEIFPAELLPNHKFSPLRICISVLPNWNLSHLTKATQKLSVLSRQFPGLHLVAMQRHRRLSRAIHPNCPRRLDFTWTIATCLSRISSWLDYFFSQDQIEIWACSPSACQPFHLGVTHVDMNNLFVVPVFKWFPLLIGMVRVRFPTSCIRSYGCFT